MFFFSRCFVNSLYETVTSRLWLTLKRCDTQMEARMISTQNKSVREARRHWNPSSPLSF